MPTSADPPDRAASESSGHACPAAVIDIGATSIRMAVAEIGAGGRVRKLEALSQAVGLGKDVFSNGSIQKSTIEECVRVLRLYRRKLVEYQITRPEQIRVAATSAVREAVNRLAFIDRVYIATGLQVEPLDEAEVIRITYLGVQPQLRADPELAGSAVAVAEVGGGSTELLVLRAGDVLFSHTYRLGALRLRRMLDVYRAPEAKQRDLMERHVQRVVEQIRRDTGGLAPQRLLALGGDARFAASQVVPDWRPEQLTRAPLAEVEELADRLLRQSDDQVVRQHHVTFGEAETLGPSLLGYALLARAYGLNEILVSNANLRDGLLHEMALAEAWNDDFRQQILRSALDLGRRFEFDEVHAVHVAELSRQLFRQLREEHQLDSRYELILYVAALLHEIGLFVSHRSLHKHSMYLIRNSELFGLSRRDVLLVSLVARYHRRASPQPTHEGYATLERDQRVVVCKLAALLRIALALDESRSQRVREIRCQRQEGRLVLGALVEDVSLEQLALNQSGTLFEETFGLRVLLRTVRSA